ncbi:PspC domain-containing protein [Micropruina sp.]|uniref:PspC domain-containing protein n=1 Tax=Micropruina sp. TaxID=2737536 RepID=UPI002636339C|nr:PspC domain-containing protein [Micropruina sp.]
MNGKTLTRSTTDKFLGGVCGGLARFLNLDSGLVRILTVLLAIFTQVGWIAYLVLWAVLPTEDGGPTGFDEAKNAFGQGSTGRSSDRPEHNPDDLR